MPWQEGLHQWLGQAESRVGDGLRWIQATWRDVQQRLEEEEDQS